MLNPDLKRILEESIAQSRKDGDDAEDAKWMAQGAAIRYGREQGMIGEDLSPEMHAAIAEAVKLVLAQS